MMMTSTDRSARKQSTETSQDDYTRTVRAEAFYGPYKKKSINTFYFMYIFMGGGFVDTWISSKLRWGYILWITFSIVFCLSTVVPCLISELMAEDKIDFVYVFSTLVGATIPPFLIAVASITLNCRREITCLLRMMDADFEIDWSVKSNQTRPSTENRFKKMRLNIWISMVTIVFITMGACFSLLRFIVTLFEPSEERFHDINSFVFPLIFIKYVNSLATYLMIIWIQILVTSTAVTVALFMMIMVISLTGYFYNEFLKLPSCMETHSSQILQHFIAAERACKYPEGDGIIASWDSPVEEISLKFKEKCIIYLHIYRHFLRVSKHLRPLISIIFPLVCYLCVTVFIPLTCYLLQKTVPTTMKVSFFSVILAISLMLFLCCYTGKLMDDANELITFAAYNLPWYLLGNKDRMLVHQIMCEIQQSPLQIRIFKIYPITLTIFLRVMNFNFSCINIVRKVLTK